MAKDLQSGEPSIDPEVRALVEEFIARVGTGRAVTALRIMIDQGHVSTEDLSARGYEHPPRAIADVRDNGIPVVTGRGTSKTGKRMAVYRLGTAEQIRVGQTGRTNFSKKFRTALFDRYGSRDAITGAEHDPRSLQIDHRVPFRVAGDAALDDVDAYMLLDAKSQRSKSWSCEHCRNFLELLDTEVCRTCFWASPESYRHVAMIEIRRADVVWQGDEVPEYDRLVRVSKALGVTVQDLLKRLGREVEFE